jgi:hypothetical protein
MAKRLQFAKRLHTDNPKLRAAVARINALGEWADGFSTARPLIIGQTPQSITLRWSPWDTPFLHPWRVWQPDPGIAHVSVAGGRVNTGDGAAAVVAGLTDVDAEDNRRIWLRIKHYFNRATASEYELETATTDFPASATTSSYQLTYIRVAEIDGSTLYQYLFSDQYVPLGDPPHPDHTKTYFKMMINGVIQWVEAGACP